MPRALIEWSKRDFTEGSPHGHLPQSWERRLCENLAGKYVDKTGLIGILNASINTRHKLIFISRSRRLGKSYAAEMLSSYYSCGCNSKALFEGLGISKLPSFSTHLNAYNVIRLDMTDILARGPDVETTVTKLLLSELGSEFPDVSLPDTLALALLAAVEHTGRKLIFVIDEWDAPIRERDEQCTHAYVVFLRSLFKNLSFTAKAVAACYLTGILPIKRYNTQSAMSEFDEFTMLDPQACAPYVGFTEQEVRALCEQHSMNFDEVRRWYDGYELSNDTDATWRVYAPFSVMRLMQRHRFASYWTNTAAYNSLLTYIDIDFDVLQEHVSHLVAGDSRAVNTQAFGNDMRKVNSADDVFTLLVHLGYLAYNESSDTVRIPNEEIRREFVSTLRRGTHRYTRDAIAASDQLSSWPTRSPATKRLWQLACRQPTTTALAPTDTTTSKHCALQSSLLIRARKYPKVLRDYGGPLLLVGITYDPASKERHCQIERMWAVQ